MHIIELDAEEAGIASHGRVKDQSIHGREAVGWGRWWRMVIEEMVGRGLQRNDVRVSFVSFTRMYMCVCVASSPFTSIEDFVLASVLRLHQLKNHTNGGCVPHCAAKRLARTQMNTRQERRYISWFVFLSSSRSIRRPFGPAANPYTVDGYVPKHLHVSTSLVECEHQKVLFFVIEK